MNMRETMNVDTDRVSYSCDVQYIAVGWQRMWSLSGCLLRDFSAHKIGFLCKEKWISLLPALDFIRWYCRQSNKLLSNKKWDGITFEMSAFFSGFFQCENVFCIDGRRFFQRQDRKLWLTWRLHRWHQLPATGYAFCSSVMFNVIWDYLCNTAVGTSGVSENWHLFFCVFTTLLLENPPDFASPQIFIYLSVQMFVAGFNFKCVAAKLFWH